MHSVTFHHWRETFHNFCFIFNQHFPVIKRHLKPPDEYEVVQQPLITQMPHQSAIHSDDSGRISAESGRADGPVGCRHWSKRYAPACARAAPFSPIGLEDPPVTAPCILAAAPPCESRLALLPSRLSFHRSPLQTMLSLFCAALNILHRLIFWTLRIDSTILQVRPFILLISSRRFMPFFFSSPGENVIVA